MSKPKKDRIDKVRKSDLIPKAYKDIYEKDVNELARDIIVDNYEIVKSNKKDLMKGLDDDVCFC